MCIAYLQYLQSISTESVVFFFFKLAVCVLAPKIILFLEVEPAYPFLQYCILNSSALSFNLAQYCELVS